MVEPKKPVKPIEGALPDLFSIVSEAFRTDAIEEFVELNDGVEIEFVCDNPIVAKVVVRVDDAFVVFAHRTKRKGLTRSSWRVDSCNASAKAIAVMHSALCKKYQRFAR